MVVTIRELLEEGEIERVKNYISLHNSVISLCCFMTKRFIPSTSKRRSILLYSCSWLKRYYTWKVFERKCNECQEYIREKIIEYDKGESK